MRESEIEARVVRHAKRRGCLCYKWSSPSQRGVPDRIIIAPSGRVLFLELKRPGEQPSPLQFHEIQKLKKQKCHATWTDNLLTATFLIDELCSGSTPKPRNRTPPKQ